MRRLQWHLSTMLLFCAVGAAMVFANARYVVGYPFDIRPDGVVSGVVTRGWPFVYQRRVRIETNLGETKFEDGFSIVSLIGNILAGLCVFLAARSVIEWFIQRKLKAGIRNRQPSSVNRQ